MPSNYKCPLCKRDAKTDNVFDSDKWWVSCETCGSYMVTYEVVSPNIERYTNIPLHLLSGVTRQASDSRNFITIATDNIPQLIQSVVVPTSPLETMDAALVYISENQTKADVEHQVFFEKDYPLAFAKDGDEFKYFLDTLVDRSFLTRRGPSQGRNNQFYRLTPEGWERVEQLKKVQIDSDQAFVAMSFSEELKDAWKDGIEPALISAGFNPMRVDFEEFEGNIDDYMIAHIRRSSLMVADFTKHSNGVYFEAGFAMGLGIHVIRMCKDTDLDDLHFDTRQYNHIVWSNPSDLREKLQNRIAATIPGRALVG